MDIREIPQGPFRRHPWETVRADFFKQVVSESCAAPQVGRVLDVGAGDGWSARQIAGAVPGARITCWDTGYPDTRTEDGVTFTDARPQGHFDLILLMDILEHVENDIGFLSGIVKDLASKDAVFLITVPAWQRLYSRHDEAFTHQRRYDVSVLRHVIHEAGLSIERESGLFHSLLVPRVLTVLKERVVSGPPPAPSPLLWKHGERSAQVLEHLLKVDTALSRMSALLRLPVPGLSHWALCRLA